MSNQQVGSTGKKKRRLSAAEKYEIFLAVVSGQETQRQVADRYGVDRSVVVLACKTARQGALDALAASVPGRRGGGRPGVDPALAEAKAEIERLRATVTEQAVALHLHEGKARWD